MESETDITREAAVANAESEKLAKEVYAIKIRKDEDLKLATTTLAEIKRVHRNIEGTRKSITAPLRLAIKNTDEVFKGPLERLKDAESLIKAEMVRYTESVEKRAEKRANKLEAAVDSGELGMGDAMAKMSGIKQAENNVNADNGSANIRVITKIRITDPSALPAKYFLRERVIEALRLEVDEDVRKRGEEVPAGAEVYTQKQVAVKVS